MTHPDLIAATDLCVKCGLCLPHCPTYRQTLDENQSPRGRLALIQGWASGALAAGPALTRHLDGCLLCRACEAVCPAQVPYGRIVDRFRAATGGAGKPWPARLRSTLLRRLLSRGGAAALTRPWAVAARRCLAGSGLLRLLGLDELDAGLPAPSGRGPVPSAEGAVTGRIDLFLGCTAELLDRATLDATLTLLARLKVAVRIPPGQTCCGALEAHAGQDCSAALAANLAAFAGPDPVVSFASGCAAMLRDYPASFAARVMDLSQWLVEHPWPAKVALRPLKAKVCLHSPCTLRNVLRAEHYPAELLRRIPELTLVPLPSDLGCCGAAGTYCLERPAMARALRDEVLDQVLAAGADLVATSNPGCALHLRAGLKQRGRGQIEVLHPATLLARQWPMP
ncbi:(Fe-S)-binding protein [Candidatus Methylocalor cossyra]|uniref:Glycolate oxidase iron-sulfur subunit n=1 Tax=Candidatus Methylocalor cossyra TaxID=3108543 RepID=A0ABM9NF23_9GAMM